MHDADKHVLCTLARYVNACVDLMQTSTYRVHVHAYVNAYVDVMCMLRMNELQMLI